jgi:lysozyme
VAATAVIVVLGGGIGLYFLARAEGADVGSLVEDVKEEIKSGAESVSADLGLSDDPIAIAMPIIQGFETFSARRYPDPPGSGKYSIGWGHQIQPGDPAQYSDPDFLLPRDEGDQLLRIDMGSAYACVTSNVSVELTPKQAAALISFCYNVGCGAFGQSTMLSLLNQGDFDGAADQFRLWIHSGGRVSDALVSRRAQEQDLFNA